MRGPMSMLRCRWLLAVCLVAAAGCGGEPERGGRPPAPPRPVTLAPSQTIGLPRLVQVNGVLQAQDELVSGFQVAGRLDQLRVDLGDQVAEGELLAALDRRDFDLEVARAEAALRQARAQLGLQPGDDGQLDLDATAPVREAQAVLADAALKRDRATELVQQQLQPPAELDAATAAFEVAQSRLQRARDEVRTWVAELEVQKQELELAKKRRQDAEIKAPWPGRVGQRHAATGQYLAVGAPVLTLLRTQPLRLRLEVPERLAGDVRPGQRVDFTVDGSDGDFTGKVVRLGSQIDRQNRTRLIEAEVDNGAGALLPGGFCRASIVVAEREEVLAVPASALVSFAGVDRVFTVDGGKAQERLVEPGRRIGELVELRRGLQPGVEVVLQPGDLVQGQAVRPGGS